MSIDAQNAATLHEARITVAEFERTTGMSTREMLMCEEGDERLSKLDNFDLMDWHYALEQINALDNVVHTFHASAFQAESFCSAFRYTRSTPRVLENSPELELQLVA